MRNLFASDDWKKRVPRKVPDGYTNQIHVSDKISRNDFD